MDYFGVSSSVSRRNSMIAQVGAAARTDVTVEGVNLRRPLSDRSQIGPVPRTKIGCFTALQALRSRSMLSVKG